MNARPAERSDAVACFIIEHQSFVEVKDCFIKSINDKLDFDTELDTFFRQKSMNVAVATPSGLRPRPNMPSKRHNL